MIYTLRYFTTYIEHYLLLNGVGQTKEQMYDSTCGYFPQSTGTLKACKHLRLGQASILCMRELFRTVVNDGDISEEIKYRGVPT